MVGTPVKVVLVIFLIVLVDVIKISPLLLIATPLRLPNIFSPS